VRGEIPWEKLYGAFRSTDKKTPRLVPCRDEREAYSRTKKSAWKEKLRRETLGTEAAAAVVVVTDGSVVGMEGARTTMVVVGG